MMTRKSMVSLMVVALSVLVTGCVGLGRGGEWFTLVKDGKPAVAFVVTKAQADEMVTGYYRLPGYCNQTGKISDVLKDFNEDLKECSGVELPVMEADDGRSQVIRFAIEPRMFEDEDRFAITFPDQRIMLITGSQFGVRWALNHVLEKFVGVRYLGRSKNAAHFPQIFNLSIPRHDITMTPSYNLHRELYIIDGYWFGRAYGKWRVDYNHGLPKVAFPVKKYMEENKWPEFIFPMVDGKKFLPYLPKDNPLYKKADNYYSGWQPCLTNKETVNEAVKNICDYFDKNPKVMSISLGVNDMGNFCQCDNCRKLGGLTRTVTGHADYSELYYKWVNQIVEEVAKKHPDKYFGLLAYREVITPPSFKLHKNIVPFICFDAQPCLLDKEVRDSRVALFKGWSERAANVGWWDYGWGDGCMDLPRVYFAGQQEMMKIAHANKVRAIFVQAEGAIQDGPKKHLYHKLMWDVNLDLEATLKDWYEACVGKEAAPYLAEYFQMWERFWREDAVKTNWFNSRKATYMSQGDKSYLYAVGNKELPKMHTLMENVVKLADKSGDKRQQLRAKWLMREFEYSEACVYAIGGQIFPPSGAVENVEQALEYLKTLPEAVRYDLKRESIFKERKADPDLGKGGFDRFYGFYVPGTLARIASFCHDPKVMKAFEDATKNPALNAVTKGLCGIFVKLESQQPVENLLKDGSFENGGGLSLETGDGWFGGTITADKAFRGKHSLKVALTPGACNIGVKNKVSGKPGNYLVSAMLYLKQDHPDVEEKVIMSGSAQKDKNGQNYNAWSTPETYVKPGEWTRISLVADIPPDRETFGLSWISFKNFAKGDVAYIDDVIITPLDTP